MRTLVWVRGKDLRIADHLPLLDGVRTGDVIPLFVLDPFFFSPKRAREMPHRIQFLLDSLAALAGEFARLGSRLIVASGKSVDVVPRLAVKWRVDRVVYQRWTEPFGRERDARIARNLSAPLQVFEGETLLPPGSVRSSAGAPYAVFTPFARAARARMSEIARPRRAPKRLPPLPEGLDARSEPLPRLSDLGITRNERLVLRGEREARKRLRRFLHERGASYAYARDRLDLPGTSRLSQDLKFGLLSPRTVWHAAVDALESAAPESLLAFENELLWREFAYATLWDRPDVLERPWRSAFEGFPWQYDERRWAAWTEGRTGYPVVDASARQLLETGFVHNRARMISASFLTKHLLIDYRLGEQHYLKYLTDGDWACNNLGWQWVAGSGCDAQPYFRVFNPVAQGQRFDPTGAYVRAWVPELSRLPERYLHCPWKAPEPVLAEAGVRLGVDYPVPIVDPDEARRRYLTIADAFLRKRRTGARPSARAG